MKRHTREVKPLALVSFTELDECVRDGGKDVREFPDLVKLRDYLRPRVVGREHLPIGPIINAIGLAERQEKEKHHVG